MLKGSTRAIRRAHERLKHTPSFNVSVAFKLRRSRGHEMLPFPGTRGVHDVCTRNGRNVAVLLFWSVRHFIHSQTVKARLSHGVLRRSVTPSLRLKRKGVTINLIRFVAQRRRYQGTTRHSVRWILLRPFLEGCGCGGTKVRN